MFFFGFVGQVMVKGTTKGRKETCWSGDGQGRSKKQKKEVFFGICWPGDGQECEKEAFLGYVCQVMAKDADGQEIVTKLHEVTREVKNWSYDRHTRVCRSCDHRVSTNLAAVTMIKLTDMSS